MGGLVIHHATLITPWDTVPDTTLSMRDGRITSIENHAESAMDADQTLDATGCTVVPGFIDMQLNGTGGIDCMRASADDLARLSALLPQFGCTAYLPTLVTASRERLIDGLTAIGTAHRVQPGGARIVGAHVEGPYLSADFKGAHDPRYVRPFDETEWEHLLSAAEGYVKLVTLAPEPHGNEGAVRRLRRDGCVVSLGHTNATYDDARQAVLEGATLATHTYNAMRGLHHREPGMLGAVFDLDALTAELIPDGIHVHPAAMRALIKAKGVDRVAAVTDASWVAGLASGTYSWEGRPMVYDGFAPRLVDGTLAGSGITADGMLRVLVREVGLTLAHALRMLTSTPAHVLGIERDAGRITVGASGDVVLLDTDLTVVATVVGGRVVYQRETHTGDVVTGAGLHR